MTLELMAKPSAETAAGIVQFVMVAADQTRLDLVFLETDFSCLNDNSLQADHSQQNQSPSLRFVLCLSVLGQA